MLKSKISSFYEKHDQVRISQGDILRDFSFAVVTTDQQVIEYGFPYVVVLNQDCDLAQGKVYLEKRCETTEALQFNQFLPSIQLFPAFPSEIIKAGEHLIKVFNVKPEAIKSDIWKLIKQNRDPRFHFLSSFDDLQVPEMVVDFKIFFSVPIELFWSEYKNHYLATINEIFRESILQRCAFYASRIGLPDLKKSP